MIFSYNFIELQAETILQSFKRNPTGTHKEKKVVTR